MRRTSLVLIAIWAFASGCAQPAAAPPSIAVPAPASVGRPSLQPRTPLLDRPWSTDQRKFTFSVIGDKAGGGGSWSFFDRSVDEINLLRPDFAIMVGDLIQGSTWGPLRLPEQWEEFGAHAGRLVVPLFILPGNHDVGGTPTHNAWWRQHIGRTYYSFEHEGCLFIALNTEEMHYPGPGGFGEQQVRFVLDELAAHRDLRHAFLFMHHPAWASPTHADEWRRIEAALGNRAYTVFAGHWHQLRYEKRNDHRYIVLGPTGAGLDPSEVPMLGLFHHHTVVTVDGDSAYIAYLEPGGAMWPVDVAQPGFALAADRVVATEALPAAGLSTGNITAGLATKLVNDLPDTVVVVRRIGRLRGGWRLVEGPDSATVVLPPGARAEMVARYAGPVTSLPSVPQVAYDVTYGGKKLFSSARDVPLVPDAVLRHPPDWEVIGPFALGEQQFRAIPDYRRAFPRMYERLGPEIGWSRDATISDGDTGLAWRHVAAGATGLVQLSSDPAMAPPQYVIGDALCAVYSPTDRVALAEFRASIFGQIVVNGRMVDDGQLYRGNYVAVPLAAGWNQVLVKVLNVTGGWSFSLRFADPDGELRFAPHLE